MGKKLLLCVVTSAIALAGLGETVKGVVGMVLRPSVGEFAAAYEKSDSADFNKVAGELVRSCTEGRKKTSIVGKAVVELQALPGFKVLRRVTVDANGKYEMHVKDEELDCRLSCRYEIGGRELAAFSPLEWDEREGAYCQNLSLESDHTSIVGRCLDTNGVPVASAVVEAHLITTPIEVEEKSMQHKVHVARSGKDGRWRIDGVDKPDFLRTVKYVCDTNALSRFDSTCPPYGIRLFVLRGPGDRESAGTAYVHNVTASDHAAVERIKSACRRKMDKDWSCPAPMTDFPVSTNNVIYVPDIVLK